MGAIRFIPEDHFPLSLPVDAPVNGAGSGINVYELVDRAAIKRGFTTVWASGWVATMGDSMHDPEEMLQKLNEAIISAKEQKAPFLAGFCQTGNFSVGWTVYTKPPFGTPIR